MVCSLKTYYNDKYMINKVHDKVCDKFGKSLIFPPVQSHYYASQIVPDIAHTSQKKHRVARNAATACLAVSSAHQQTFF